MLNKPSMRKQKMMAHVSMANFHALQPLKRGHLTNQDTFFCPRVSRLEVPLYSEV